MPAPRYSATVTASPAPAPRPGADTDALLQGLGYGADRIADLRTAGAIG
jgi:alpha-methylacyl-CoA racemase